MLDSSKTGKTGISQELHHAILYWQDEEQAQEPSHSESVASPTPGASLEPTDLDIQLQGQQKMILQFKEMIRERETALQDRERELKVSNSSLVQSQVYM